MSKQLYLCNLKVEGSTQNRTFLIQPSDIESLIPRRNIPKLWISVILLRYLLKLQGSIYYQINLLQTSFGILIFNLGKHQILFESVDQQQTRSFQIQIDSLIQGLNISNSIMNNTLARRILVYRDHILPQIRKPIHTIPKFLAIQNPSLDRFRIQKMNQLLNEDERKKIQIQRNAGNEKINMDLQQYQDTFINPLSACPAFYQILFNYSILKSQLLSKGQNSIDSPQSTTTPNNFEFFHIKQNKIINDLCSSAVKLSQRQVEQKSRSQINAIFQVYRRLYPYQKKCVYRSFQMEYKKFLIQKQNIRSMILDKKIFYKKPLLVMSPFQLYQAKNPQRTLKQCQQAIANPQNKLQWQRINKQFQLLLQAHYQQIQYIKQNYKIPNQSEIWKQFKRQYTKMDQYKSFYSILKLRDI